MKLEHLVHFELIMISSTPQLLTQEVEEEERYLVESHYKQLKLLIHEIQ